MMTVVFNVPGNPVGKQRARYAKRGNFVQTYTPEKTRTYETLIREHAQQAMGSSEPLETPVTVYLYVRLPIPSSYSKNRRKACLDGFEMPTKKPDASNILKSIEDAMNGVVFKDDSQIVNIHVTKVYATEPGVDVCVKECLP
jgi:Holliday junction resolvase RusA-like endonuclease